MNKKTRIILLSICSLIFLILSPLLVGYSIGYRLDFENKKIVTTGGIYIKSYPLAEEVIIDSKISAKPGIFTNAAYIQSLLPKEYTVLVKKTGYYDYQKKVKVKEKEVTKIENIILFKRKFLFSPLLQEIDSIFFSPNFQNFLAEKNDEKSIFLYIWQLNNFTFETPLASFSIPLKGEIKKIYWSDDSNGFIVEVISGKKSSFYLVENITLSKITPLSHLDNNCSLINLVTKDEEKIIFFLKENNLYKYLPNKKPEILIKDILTYTLENKNILLLSQEGVFLKSNLEGKILEDFTPKNFIFNQNKKYQIIPLKENLFLKENNFLFFVNKSDQILENFDSPEDDYQLLLSPDKKHLLYCGKKEIYTFSFKNNIPLEENYQKIFSGKEIKQCQWLNNDYIIFSSGDDIIISEIDYRGNINTINLSPSIEIENQKIELNKPSIFFDSSSKKLYIFTQKSLFQSEKLLP